MAAAAAVGLMAVCWPPAAELMPDWVRVRMAWFWTSVF
jgi:hypothetical protein